MRRVLLIVILCLFVTPKLQAQTPKLKSGLVDAGFTLVTPEDPELSGGVCIIQVERGKNREAMNRLYEEHGIACAPTGGLRLCPHVYNTMEHVERAVRGVKAVLA